MSSKTKPLPQRLAAALAAMRNPELDGVNPHFRSKYATLESVLKAIRPALHKQGLALTQTVTTNERVVLVNTTILDQQTEQQESYISSYPLPEDCARNIQKMGAAITYLRRYTLLSLFALVGEPDDDGNLAALPPQKPKPKPKQENTPITRNTKNAIWRAAMGAGLDKEAAKAFTSEITENITESAGQAILQSIDKYVKHWLSMQEG